ncbi:MAG: hypothetical protein PHN42_01300 [Bacilli bacterium]|nr:hypothetical protein [Bacilli bacterium]
MGKKLPSIYANKIDKELSNNTKISVTKNEKEQTEKNSDTRYKSKNINQKIKDIFNSPKYVYKASVIITLKDKKISRKIIGQNNNSLITIDNELISKNDIIDIEYEN